MYSNRYGDLRRIAALTDGECHLCHQPAHLDLYGPTGLFGHDTVTVDHLRPQFHGGDDDPENLRLAHGVCNSIRGTRVVEDVRWELAGTTEEPMSAGAKDVVSLGAGAAAAILLGNATAERKADGTRRFNFGVALLGGLVVASLSRSLL